LLGLVVLDLVQTSNYFFFLHNFCQIVWVKTCH
jgi:hypothetical protein